MKCIHILLSLTIFGGTWRLGRPTCVLESDFGFVLNCAFKKSGLFRVRNLGGVKAHIGLGFTVGDELGFKESLSNVENNRRRSAEASRLQAQIIEAQQKTKRLDNAIRVRSPVPSVESVPVPRYQVPTTKTGTVPPFKPIPPAPERPAILHVNTTKMVPTPMLMGIAVPTFSSMPASISRISLEPAVHIDAKKNGDKLSSTNFSIRTLPTPNNDLSQSVAANLIQDLSGNGNVSEVVQNLLLQKLKTKTTTTTTTTIRPVHPHRHSSARKVMNAPREYYPVGYDKNFDDNFSSKVELPETSFYCGDQKHFPGLYADEDLGCMVFHVCVLTDDGLIMKSFLCPESTLFDQTILKCNWWFYVDCKNSKKLYDSNIPISKSYQLMKALTFFSAYKKDSAQTKDPKD